MLVSLTSFADLAV